MNPLEAVREAFSLKYFWRFWIEGRVLQCLLRGTM
jgi:hypothetical protein